MSDYGRLWQRCADIRDDLKRIVPNADVSTLEAATKSVAGHKARLDYLLAEWKRLEARMAMEPDDG
jgi:hypothetical protein